MSFSQSNLTTGNFTKVALSGTKGIAIEGSTNSSLYYSTDSGSTWTLSLSGGNSINTISLSGNNGIAGGISFINDPVIYYTSDGGLNWTATTSLFTPPLTTVSNVLVSISGSNAIAGLTSLSGPNDCAAYYSGDGGVTWTLGFSLTTGGNESINNVAVDGNTMIVVTSEGISTVIRNSTDSGVTWNSVLTLASSFNPSLSLSGANAILVGQSIIGAQGFLRYSSDNGTTWNTPTTTPTLTNNYPKKVSISGSVGMAGGINNTTFTSFIWYTTDGGANWTASSQSLANSSTFTSMSVSGNNGLASINDSSTVGYLYYSTDQGSTWTLANSLTATTINSAALSGNQGISGTSAGIYYTTSPLCYEENTLILVSENEEEVYKKVSELKVGDLVKTYKQGYKKINLLRSFSYKPLDRNNELNLLYKHKENGVILTAGHSILVDELTEQEKLNNIKYSFSQTIEDKKLLLACSSDKFEKIDDDQEYHLYHFSLESDEPKAHFGVYINDGILSESCSEEALLRMF
jgi:photosystem II stability/assembly factor-like uncharacterized protein